MQESRYLGMFFGAILGDALGAPNEFKTRDSYEHITELTAGGAFNLPKGAWTDDTSMMLCLSESLTNLQRNDPLDQLDLYEKWYTTGYLSSTGKCFDIGNTVLNAIKVSAPLRSDPDAHENTVLLINDEEQYNGNGALMRIAPLIIKYWNSPTYLYQIQKSSRATHSHRINLDACVYFAMTMYHVMNNIDKEYILPPSVGNGIDFTVESLRATTRDEIISSGYVVDTLKAALWCFYQTDNFKDAIVLAANLGDDSDTVACVTGIIAGGYYGYDDLPIDMINQLVDVPMLYNKALDLIKTNMVDLNGTYHE